jgi:hypothetical protein
LFTAGKNKHTKELARRGQPVDTTGCPLGAKRVAELRPPRERVRYSFVIRHSGFAACNEPLTGRNDLIFARLCHFFLEIRFPILLPNIPQIVLDNIAVRN